VAPSTELSDLSDLPVEACIGDVRRALCDAGHAVLAAPPGAGKTTIVPLRLLDEPWLGTDRIVVLEPRRLAARAAARRMAALLGEEVGATVGFRTRDEARVSRATRIEVVTEGILTRRLQRDAALPGVGLVVFDEVHERNLQTDLALALVLDARSVLVPELRVLAMSATLDTRRVSALLGGEGEAAPVITSAGRSHDVEIRWRPPGPRDRPAEAVQGAVLHALRHDEGDALVFLAGAADIRRVTTLLERSVPADVDVRPLFGALSAAEQDAALLPSPAGRRRVVLATDIAETSLTVAGVRIVVDSGLVRTPRFEARSGLTRLVTGPTSRASAEQRAGRAGRTSPGVAHRLWSEAEHGTRRPFAAPEITMVDLAGFALELAEWGADAAELRFLDPPPARALGDAQSLLTELGALDGDGRITASGRAMVALPVHPRLARMLVVAAARGEGAMASALAAVLEERDVLRAPPEARTADIAERVQLVLDPSSTHAEADRRSLAFVRRRAHELQRRLGVAPDPPTPPTACGPVLALAYPDRIAQARGAGRFRLRNGTAAELPTGDPLIGEPFLVVADLDADAGTGRPRPSPRAGAASMRDPDHRIRLAAALDREDVERAGGDAITDVTTVRWDDERDDLRARTERRLGALVLASSDGPAAPGTASAEALVDHVRRTNLGALRWTDSARTLQARVGYARRAFGDWADLSDDALLATLDDWLGPRLTGASGRADLERIDVFGVLRDMVGHHRIPELDRIVPRTLVIATGREVPIDYRGETPAIAVRAQDLFGTTVHPSIAQGRIPITVTLLSPAGRPVQVTADLPGFWRGSWADVRKDMAGRYPKHPWPVDPATAAPPPRRAPRAGS
jgi:ATP-dependent helicase HrpB